METFKGLKVLTGKNYRQIKLQRLQKVQLWAFGLLVHFFFFFISFISQNIKFTPFTTKYKNKIIIIITICGRTYIIYDSNKIFLVQRQGLQES